MDKLTQKSVYLTLNSQFKLTQPEKFISSKVPMKERTESQIPEYQRDDGVGEEMVMEFFVAKVHFLKG